MIDEIFKSVLTSLARYEPNHESPLLSINDGRNVTANLISVTAAIQDPKYLKNPKKPVLWFRKSIEGTQRRLCQGLISRRNTIQAGLNY